MPYRITKGGGAKPWKIQKKEGGIWKTVGRSKTKAKAQASIGHRESAERK